MAHLPMYSRFIPGALTFLMHHMRDESGRQENYAYQAYVSLIAHRSREQDEMEVVIVNQSYEFVTFQVKSVGHQMIPTTKGQSAAQGLGRAGGPLSDCFSAPGRRGAVIEDPAGAANNSAHLLSTAVSASGAISHA